MRSEIRRTTLEKTFERQGTLSQTVVRIVKEAARDQEGNGDAGGSRTPQSEGKGKYHGHTPAHRFTHREKDSLELYNLAEGNRYSVYPEVAKSSVKSKDSDSFRHRSIFRKRNRFVFA